MTVPVPRFAFYNNSFSYTDSLYCCFSSSVFHFVWHLFLPFTFFLSPCLTFSVAIVYSVYIRQLFRLPSVLPFITVFQLHSATTCLSCCNCPPFWWFLPSMSHIQSFHSPGSQSSCYSYFFFTYFCNFTFHVQYLHSYNNLFYSSWYEFPLFWSPLPFQSYQRVSFNLGVHSLSSSPLVSFHILTFPIL